MNINDINLVDYNYDLPEDRIAQYPVTERDMSQLLVYKKEEPPSRDIFRNICNYLPADSLLVFNNSKVIRARILFRKGTGAGIEILCLEPLKPAGYEQSFGSTSQVEWKCIVGNLKKWKNGLISSPFLFNEHKFNLTAEKICSEGEAWRIRFTWDCNEINFGEVINATGHIPLPPYIKREDDTEDSIRYQTIYSSIKGSVAAPTAGLHFTDTVLAKLRENRTKLVEITLHVGAGTFQPIKTRNIADHEMHCEHFSVTRETVQSLIENHGKIIPVGTTSVRTLESLYWLGVKLINQSTLKGAYLALGQWDAYEKSPEYSVAESLNSLLNHMMANNLSSLNASTSIMIVPGYTFKMMDGLITNFHQPNSTLLLLVSAWVGDNWRDIYKYALDNNFRFLSYGDCSLLLN